MKSNESLLQHNQNLKHIEIERQIKLEWNGMEWNEREFGLTLEGSTLGKLLTTETTLSTTSSLVRWSSCDDINRTKPDGAHGFVLSLRVCTGTRMWCSTAALNAIFPSVSLSISLGFLDPTDENIVLGSFVQCFSVNYFTIKYF